MPPTAPLMFHRQAVPAPSARAAPLATAPAATQPIPEEQARADLYALAARLLLAVPDDILLRNLADARDQADGNGVAAAEPVEVQRESALATAWERLTTAASVMPAEAIADEFAALFEGIGKPLLDPYASVYVAGFMMEKPLAALRGDLAALGIGRAPRATVTEDHLGALCETMRLLIAGAPGLPPRPFLDQQVFFARHLEPWAGRCLDDIEKTAPANFYRCVAGFVRQLLCMEGRAFTSNESTGAEPIPVDGTASMNRWSLR